MWLYLEEEGSVRRGRVGVCWDAIIFEGLHRFCLLVCEAVRLKTATSHWIETCYASEADYVSLVSLFETLVSVAAK